MAYTYSTPSRNALRALSVVIMATSDAVHVLHTALVITQDLQKSRQISGQTRYTDVNVFQIFSWDTSTVTVWSNRTVMHGLMDPQTSENTSEGNSWAEAAPTVHGQGPLWTHEPL